MAKSTVDEIRERFDNDVERFANLDTGQSATMDSPLGLDLIAEAAAVTTPLADSLLDLGCGAGNYTLKLLERLANLNVTLVDLSQPMLDRAQQRVGVCARGAIRAIQGDLRQLDLGVDAYDIVLAASVLHHLRTDDQWRQVFASIFESLRSGGSFWIFDLITSDLPGVQAMMWRRYGDYLVGLKDAAYREQVFAYVEHEDTPRSLEFQLDLLKQVGFAQITVLHKHGPFAAFGAIKR